MGKETGISWCHHTFNLVWGCFKVSEGCKNCYADTLASRYGFDVWGPPQTTERRTFGEKHWAEPLSWNKEAERQGVRKRVFCASMADVFEDHPTVNQERVKLWPLIEQTPMLDWLLLTKRPENLLAMSPYGSNAWPRNIWVGTSVETQEWAEQRIPHLLQVTAIVRFLSCEPLLGPVNLSSWLPELDWVITGGESGDHARPLNLDWVRTIRDQCLTYGCPHFFKQVGGRTSKSGGRLLDGRTWDEFPQVGVMV